MAALLIKDFRRPPDGVYVHNGGFTVSWLRLEAGRYEMRFSACSLQNQWQSEGACWVTGDTLVLAGLPGRPDRYLKMRSRNSLVETHEDGYEAEFVRE